VNEKYGIYEFTFGGGMEHQTITGQGGTNGAAFDPWLSRTSWPTSGGRHGDVRDVARHLAERGFATYAEALWDEGEAGAGGSRRSSTPWRSGGQGTWTAACTSTTSRAKNASSPTTSAT